MGAQAESMLVAVILHPTQISLDRGGIHHQRGCGVIYRQLDPTHQKTFQYKQKLNSKR
jgi:hypothetical protein